MGVPSAMKRGLGIAVPFSRLLRRSSSLDNARGLVVSFVSLSSDILGRLCILEGRAIIDGLFPTVGVAGSPIVG
jgi:hypothetical protein